MWCQVFSGSGLTVWVAPPEDSLTAGGCQPFWKGHLQKGIGEKLGLSALSCDLLI